MNVQGRRHDRYLVLQQDHVVATIQRYAIRFTIFQYSQHLVNNTVAREYTFKVNKRLAKAPIAAVSIIQRNKVNAGHATEPRKVVLEEVLVVVKRLDAGNVDRVRVHLAFLITNVNYADQEKTFQFFSNSTKNPQDYIFIFNLWKRLIQISIKSYHSTFGKDLSKSQSRATTQPLEKVDPNLKQELPLNLCKVFCSLF